MSTFEHLCRTRRAVGCVASMLALITAAAVAPLPKASAQDDANILDNADRGGGEGGQKIELETPDGVFTVLDYYPTLDGKDAVPVIFVHDRESKAADLKGLATALNAQGYAVVAPDLRGHGRSLTRRPSRGRDRPERLNIRPDRLNSTVVNDMLRYDMETVKRFLFQRNNEKQLNIEKLAIVGVGELGSAIALAYTRLDHSKRQVGRLKLGQDIKAVFLISPRKVTLGVNNLRLISDKYLQDPPVNRQGPPNRNRITVTIFTAGKDKKVADDAETLSNTLANKRQQQPKEPDKRNSFFFSLDTNLEATKMLGVAELKIAPRIAAILKLRLKENTDRTLSWTQRPVSN